MEKLSSRKQFTFYRSFFEAVSNLPKKDQADVLLAICAYALDGDEIALKGTAKAVFCLVKPTLDSSRKKSEVGLSGVSKREANRKQTASKPQANRKQRKSENSSEANQKLEECGSENKKENKIENECSLIPPTAPPIDEKSSKAQAEARAAVLADYCSRLNPTPSGGTVGMLEFFTDLMGPDVCKRAFDVALDEKKTAWSYVRAVLKGAADDGVRCLADWDERQRRRAETKKTAFSPKPIQAACSGPVPDLEKEAVRRMMEGG